ncbi:MAG: cytochrome b/b6 domain-containing protein, partial [Alphaproteobacteria bacterium]|nr:cytochrome b/b6 domain-containing protein [Alphaproteobacteria bacterium]
DHARLRFPTGAAALHHNILQKISYLGVICGLIPLMILSGLTLSPGWVAAWPWLYTLFGGRASARSIHFIGMSLIVAFILIHLIMVVLAGPFNEIRSMITGKFRLPKERGEQQT